MATCFVDRNVLEGRARNTAIECRDERVSYQQLLERTNRVGHVLRGLGVKSGERVLLLLPDTPEFLYCFFGAIKIGAVAVPLNTLLKPHEYEFLLNDAQAKVAVVGEFLLPLLEVTPRERFKYLREIAVVGKSSQRHLCLGDAMAESSSELQPAPMGKEAPAFWLYSSGSTGPPKACVHAHQDMLVCSERYAKGILNIHDRDRCYSVARLFFAYGLGNAGYFPLYAGATTILSPAHPTPAGIYADIERYRPTLFFSVPSNYAALLAHQREDGREFDLSSVRLAISAGETLPAVVFERFKQRFGIEILDGLGSTETLQTVISNRPGQVRPGSSGKVVPGYEAKIVDDNGQSVPVGEVGTLMIKGDSVCSGYWNGQGQTEGAFADHWFRTGDKYYQDQDGYFWNAGRTVDTFKVNGRWLNPSEVEGALIAHPSVCQAAVVPREDEVGLTKAAAYVVLVPNVRPSEQLVREIKDLVAQRVGSYKRPKWILFVNELPKTATGKVQRFKLREMQVHHHSSRVADDRKPAS
ncbi:MAG TPA: benzoate-CoA ligase family protein [Candidatus Acidoferrum sp.]|nr:benzoate-CoA ligase family protein [Candidatus Acidoferrum sp.]